MIFSSERIFLSAFCAVFFSVVAPLIVHAQASALGLGCHLATEQEQQQMLARGIPRSFQVCPKDMQILGIGENFDQWYAQLKAMSPCNKNTCTLSCRTRNTGAQVCGPTATRWSSIGCHPNNRTAIFPSVAYGFAAHIELLRRYCGERGRCTIDSVVQQWTAIAGDRSAYANFISRGAGIPVNKVFDPNDINLIGRLALSMSCFEAGSLPYDPAELKQGLIMAGGGARQPVPANVGQLLNDSMVGGYAANPAGSPNSQPGSWAYPPSSTGGNSYTPPPPPPSPLPVLPQQQNSQTNPQTNQTTQMQTSQSGAQANTSNTSAIFPPAGLIIAQKARVNRGENISVSWTSVGMDTNSSCQILSDGIQIATGKEGTRSIQASTVPISLNSITVVEECRTPIGASAKSSVSITII